MAHLPALDRQGSCEEFRGGSARGRLLRLLAVAGDVPPLTLFGFLCVEANATRVANVAGPAFVNGLGGSVDLFEEFWLDRHLDDGLAGPPLLTHTYPHCGVDTVRHNSTQVRR